MINVKTILGAVGLLLAIVVTLATVKIETVEGNEIGVLETWGDGVAEEALTPKTYIYVPGFNKRVYTYEINQQVFVMNDNKEDFAEGRDADSYLVQSADQQDMWVNLTVQWRRDPLKVVDLHKTVRDAVEERLIRPEVMLAVKNAATKRKALEAYAGLGLVELQKEIEDSLRSSTGELAERGVIVDTFVIERIRLDKKYTEEIKAKQVAVQARLRAIEEEKAAIAKAAKAKADAQADYEKQIVEAKRDKERGILEAQKQAEQKILAAEAQKRQVELAAAAEKARNVLEAEGEKEAGELRAQAILALGKAEAEATKLKLQAYAVPGAESFVKIEVAKQMPEAFKGIKGYLPSDMTVNLLTEQYTKGVSVLAEGAGE